MLLARTFWLWPALLTLGLGVRGSWRPELWRDELATWSAATRSTGDLLDLLNHVDAVSGMYYLLMHFWVSAFGDSPTVFRLPSALAMAGAAVFVALTGRKQFGTATGLVAGLLFAVLPSVSRFSQEARSYAFAVLAVAAATWLLLRALERPTVLRWLPYAVSVALAGLFHMVALCVLAPHAVLVAMRWWRGRSRGLLIGFPVAVLVALAPVAPLVILGRRQVGRQISWLHSPTLQDVATVWHGLFQSSLVSLCVLAMAALPAAWSAGRRPAFEIGLVAALPLAAVWIVSQGQTAYFIDRYLLFTVPAWAVLAAAGLTALRPRAMVAVGLIAAALLGIQDQQALRNRTSHEWADEKGAAKIVADGYQPGDGMVPVRGEEAYMMLDFALGYYLPDRVQPKDVFAAKTPLQNDDLYAVDCPEPAACAADVQRIWVVTYSTPEDPFKGLSEAEAKVLKSDYKVQQTKHVQGLTVTLLARSGAAH
ncbi:glycosyltransferase family 39 protein [Kitasatospora sp. CB01950]|uniref:glycosyltransferase family 39 protein n=1 Tax=Kitasatospora sp. CB01950 TaxID=1703930 RepID=UPI001301635A|nr:glycosyltransferase family 39 protein [Kitasatospora sp. CB01950]